MIDIDAKTKLSGPMFDGTADNIIERATERGEKDIADQGYVDVQKNLATSLRNPTGYYQSHIHVVKYGSAHQVNDSGVVYGPWLEGTGSRNRSTRFKGYAAFRRAGQMLDKKAQAIMERNIRVAAARL